MVNKRNTVDRDFIINTKFEELFTSDEFATQTESLFKEVKELLSPYTLQLNKDTQLLLFDQIDEVIYNTVYKQAKLAYYQAFNDAYLVNENN